MCHLIISIPDLCLLTYFGTYRIYLKPALNAHADVTSKAIGLNFGTSLSLRPGSMYASCDGYGESD